MSDLRQRVPGHSLIDELLHQWDLRNIRVDEMTRQIVVDEEARSWYRGVVGERRVASILRQLGPEWTVLHSVPVGAGTTDIDHIAIGPTGVFTINTKYSPGKDVWVAGTNLQVSGRPLRYVHATVAEAIKSAARLSYSSGLDISVTGIIVFVDPQRITIRDTPGDDSHVVQVVSDRQLLDTLRGSTMLMPHEIARVVEVAVLPNTWHQSPAPSTIGDHIEREFSALEQAVGPGLAAPAVGPAAPRPAPPARKPNVRRTASRPTQRRSNKRKRRSLAPDLIKLGLLIIGGFWAYNYLTNLAG